MSAGEANAVVKTRIRKTEREQFRKRAAAAGQSIASRLALLIRQDLQREDPKP